MEELVSNSLISPETGLLIKPELRRAIYGELSLISSPRRCFLTMHGWCFGDKMTISFSRKLLFTSLLFTALQSNADSIFEPVIVTAGRFSQNLTDSLASTTLITREDIEKSSAITLDELLGSVNSLDVKSTSNFGKSSSVFMRGTNSSHVLTIVDGVKLYSATGGSAAYQHIPLSQIDHIEIVRGPRSSLYGSEAIGGVIQIFTRKGKNESDAELTLQQGSYKTESVDAGFSGKNGDLAYSLYGSQFYTDGIDSISHTTANDDDGYTNRSISTGLNYQLSKTVKLNASILSVDGTTLYDNCYNASYATSDNCYSDVQQQVISTSAQFTPDSQWDGNLQLGFSKDASDNFWEDTPNNSFLTDRYNISFQNNFQLTDTRLLIFGIDYSEDKVTSDAYTSPFDKTRDNTAVFISLNNNNKKFQTGISIRSDENEQFGQHSTGTLSAGYAFSKQAKIYASYGTAFKAPTFNELYFPFYGDPDLKPEQSESLEFGYRNHQENFKLDANLYYTTIDELINYDSLLLKANNISKAEISGIELSLSTKVSDWDVKASTSYVDPINKDAAYNGKQLPGRVNSSTSIDLFKQFKSLQLGLAIVNQSERYTDANNTNKLDAYTRVDIKLTKKLNKHITLSASINNVFDEDYSLNAFSSTLYNTPGRSVFVKAQYRM